MVVGHDIGLLRGALPSDANGKTMWCDALRNAIDSGYVSPWPPREWVFEERYEEILEALGDVFLEEVLFDNGGEAMGLLSDLLSSAAGVAKEIGSEAIEGFGNAVAEVRSTVVMEPFFGRGDMGSERVGDAIGEMGDAIVEGNRGMLADMAGQFGASPTVERGQEITIGPEPQPDLEQER